jgi:hypothetical protein
VSNRIEAVGQSFSALKAIAQVAINDLLDAQADIDARTSSNNLLAVDKALVDNALTNMNNESGKVLAYSNDNNLIIPLCTTTDLFSLTK